MAQLLHLQRLAGNAALARRLPRAPVQRVRIANEQKSNIMLAVRLGGDRYHETVEILQALGDENFDSEPALQERIQSLLPSDGVYLGGRAVAVRGRGQRYDVHISFDRSLRYIRQYLNEVRQGEDQQLRVGEGRVRRNALYGSIRYDFDGSTFTFWHAHDEGRMG